MVTLSPDVQKQTKRCYAGRQYTFAPGVRIYGHKENDHCEKVAGCGCHAWRILCRLYVVSRYNTRLLNLGVNNV